MNTRASLVFALNMQGVGLTMDKTAPFQCTQQRVQILGAGQESAALGTWRGSPTRLSDVVWDWKDGCLVQLRPVSVIFRHVKDPGQICIDGCFFCLFFQNKYIEIKFCLQDMYYKANQQNIFSNPYKENVLSKGISWLKINFNFHKTGFKFRFFSPVFSSQNESIFPW